MIPSKIELNDKAVRELLQRLITGHQDLTPLMRSVRGFLLDRVEENFAEQGRPKWAPLSPVTVERRGNSGPILQRSGQLAASISAESDASSATVGTNKVYGPVMQTGAKKGEFGKTSRGAPIPWGNIPARPFVALADSDHPELLELVIDYQKNLAR